MTNFIHPLKIETAIQTVEFEGENRIPDKSLGDEVLVDIETSTDGSDLNVTVRIGNYLFLPEQLKNILRMTEEYKTALNMMTKQKKAKKPRQYPTKKPKQVLSKPDPVDLVHPKGYY